nr:hypothetical protein [Tanacetum cinerariifolium]
MIKFVKAIDSPTEVKISKVKTIRKPYVKYVEMYRNTTKSPKEIKEKMLRPQLVGFGDLNKTLLKKDGGYVSFGQGCGKITGKGIIKTVFFSLIQSEKKDERGIVIRNKARLVAQRHTQEKGIDYKEFFAPVARIEAIRLFLAYASFMGFTTLFIRKHRGDFLLVQVYVDDIIFGSSNLQLCREFAALMHEKFQMSAMANTPIDKENPWGKDETSKDVDFHLYRSMIGSLMYLTGPDIMFAVCACARHQVTPKECHMHAVKRIFRYLKGHPKLGIWYPKDSLFDLVAYSDSDYGGATQVYQMDVKSVFLYGTIDEEVYVMQPPGFQDPEFPATVYKVDKAMYRLHQAPRA